MNFNRAIFLKIDNDFLAETCERFINGVINNLPEAVHETATIG